MTVGVEVEFHILETVLKDGIKEVRPFDRTSYCSTAASDTYLDSNEADCQKTAPTTSSSGCRDSLDSMVSPYSRDSQGKCYKSSGESLRTLCLTSKLRGRSN